MPITIKTRKPVDQFAPSDFKAFPIWEFASDEEGVDGQDETWVRPVQGHQVPLGAYSQLVGADLTTPKGRKLEGFMIVTTTDGLIEISSGSIVGRGLYFVLPTISREEAIATKEDWSIKDREALGQALQLSEEDLFPLYYELRVRIRGEKANRKGTVV